MIEEKGEYLRRRTFDPEDEIAFTDTLFISDSEIAQDEVSTVLEFLTTDWGLNMKNLRTRGSEYD